MTRSELIKKIAERNPHLNQHDTERIVSAILEQISEAMSAGERVELRGFGAFSVKEQSARAGRNPRTGERVEIEAKRKPYFKAGKQLHDRLNG